jgi:CRP-like cAMP-binding protein
MNISKQSFAATRGCASSCPVRQFGLCNWFESPTSGEIAARCTQTQFAPGAPILSQGEEANRVGIIQQGLVKIVLNDTNGEEHLIQLLYPGEMVGDPFATDSAFSWQAATQTSLCWMPRSALAEAIRTSPMASRRHGEATKRLLQEHHFAQAALRSRNAVQKVAHWLFLQMPVRRGPGNVRMRLVLCRRDLASLLEMTVETLCRSLQQLQGRRAICLLAPDLVEICDPARLRLLAKGYDDERLQETLLAEGWEWGARALGPKLTARPTSDSKPAVVTLRAS